MIELAKHIEVLLLENDCVIVPDLGGFIAHYRPAIQKEDGQYLPPVRTIGFNAQLVINDGLLVQSYMQTYNTDFPDATRKIEKVVEYLKDNLYQQGQVCFNNIGILYYNMSGNYEFVNANESFFTPSLYGLEEIFLPELTEVKTSPLPTTNQEKAKLKIISTSSPKSKNYQITPAPQVRPYHWWQNAIAIVAAVLLFFIFSVPVENTYITEEANYASLGSANFFNAVRSQSMASSITIKKEPMSSQETSEQEKVVAQQKKNNGHNINTLKPVTIRTEKIKKTSEVDVQKANKATEKAEKVNEKTDNVPETTKKAISSKVISKGTIKSGFYVIVASLQNATDAQQEVDNLSKAGYSDAQVLESDGRFRIALLHYDEQSAAYRKVQELKGIKRFQSAWVFSSK